MPGPAPAPAHHFPPWLQRAGRAAVPGVILAAALVAGFRPVGRLPPLGPFLEPAHGVWAVAAQSDLPDEHLTIPGLRDTVRVVFDERAVPHVFAHSVADAARTLGYLHARFRLFQLELQTRATTGTLSEWLGPSLLAFDRSQRRLGLAWSAERDYAALDSTSEIADIVNAYAEGVNARIDELRPGDLPLEYRLLNARPQRWQPVNSFYLMKQMGFILAYLPDELRYQRLAAAVGPGAAAGLMPVNSPIQEPIVPTRFGVRVLPEDIPLPTPPMGAEGQSGAAGGGPAAGRAVRQGGNVSPSPVPSSRGPGAVAGRLPWSGDGAGWREASNNWVVAPWRSANGHALLAGDPHLDLTLPSVWFEVHLVVPGRLDLYGVSFPGGPVIPIGFNRDVAWSFTNTGADVLDFYDETLDDSTAPTRYLLDGTWRPLETRVETYRDRHGAVLAVDTSYFTHRGPLIRSDGHARSMRWTVLERQDAVQALWGVGQAHSVNEWLGAMQGYRAPAQNGAVADRQGEIAILSAGAYPIRPSGGNGLTIWDGTTSASDWKGFLPPARYPYARNPAQGYLASANQQPVDPAVDAFYFGANWPAPWRALRINTLLAADSSATPDAMRLHQTDPGSAQADWFVPAFLSAVDREALAGRATAEMKTAAGLLSEWDRHYTKRNERAVLFEYAMRALAAATWDELLVPGDTTDRRVFTPSSTVLGALLQQPQSPWWDDHRTPDVVETRDDILAASLATGYLQLVRDRGPPERGGWRWDEIRHQNIWHVLHLKSLSALDIPVQGGPGTLNPSAGAGTHGSSWRMVVDLGPVIRAWGVYPGGQSGNPLSPWYADRIAKWADGELDELPFPATPAELPAERRLEEVVATGGGR
jgi:penicillin amidase